jgi:hypothetical protein
MNHKHLIAIALALKAKKGIGLEQLVSKLPMMKDGSMRISE